MTDVTTDVTDAPSTTASSDAPAKRARKGAGLSGMVLAELHQMASGLGITGTSKMRKGELIEAIQAHQRNGGGSVPRLANRPDNADQGAVEVDETRNAGAGTAPAQRDRSDRPATERDIAGTRAPQQVSELSSGDDSRDRGGKESGQSGRDRQPASGQDRDSASGQDSDEQRQAGDTSAQERDNQAHDNRGRDNQGRDNQARDEQRQARDTSTQERDNQARDNQARDNQARDNQGRDNQGQRGRTDQNQGGNQNNQGGRDGQSKQQNQNNQNQNNQNQNNQYQNDDDDGGGRGRRRRRGRDRYRDRERPDRGGNRNRNASGGRDEEPQVTEDDVLVPIAGILDVLDNYAFVRTSGYLTGSNDVYVSLSQVRKHGLRRGDAITGAVKATREGERREKYNALVRLDTINGLDPDAAQGRPEFTKLTPLYPQERLRLETESNILTTRIIDLVMPIGKGQRALIVSPPKAGKTSVLQAIANAITTNNPECHLMVVLVDERPEEVTDMQRSVKGEVIASTFDRPPADHTTVAELSIERAKRLVELGHDVVVLLDSITRLGRAYNLAAPTSGRILSGGVDSTALYPPKRFLGAARNIEHGGSLTILATALVETGSMMDTVIFEEFKGTGNAELKLDRRIADKRVFPAVDVDASGTRKEEILLSRDELAIIIKLRRVLGALDPIEAIDLLISRLKKSQNNAEFLMQIAKSTPGKDDD